MGLLSYDLLHTTGFPSTTSTTRLTSYDLMHSKGLPYRDLLVILSIFTSPLSKHYYGMGMNAFLGISQSKSISGVSSVITWISALNFWKAVPFNGFVKWSAKIIPVGEYLTLISLINILSLIWKDLTDMCFVQLTLDNVPLFYRSMELNLSCYMAATSTSNPCDSIKYLGHRNAGSTLSAHISSASAEILDFSFFLLDMISTDPHPRVIVATVWIQQYGCISYDESIHHFTIFSLSTLNINGMWMVDMMYCSTHHSLLQSSSSGILTLVVRNATAVWIYFLMWVVANKSCATEWWNSVS